MARRRLLGCVLVWGLLAWGVLNPTRLLVVDDLLDHPFALGALGWALLVATVVAAVRDPTRRLAAGVLLAGVGATAFALAGLVASTGVSRERAEHVVPGPGAFDAVVIDDGAFENRVARVLVQDRAWSLTAHRVEAACVCLPHGPQPVRGVRWVDPTTLTFEADGSSRTVTLSADGSPVSPLSVGVRCR